MTYSWFLLTVMPIVPLYLSFIFPIIALNREINLSKKNEAIKKWTFLYALLPSITLCTYWMFPFTIETFEILKFIIASIVIYFFSTITIWLFVPKQEWNMLFTWLLRICFILAILWFSFGWGFFYSFRFN